MPRNKKLKKIGRPSGYYPEICQELIDFFSVQPFRTKKVITTGKNDYYKEEEVEIANPLPHLVTFARKIGVSYYTIWNWGKIHPEFSDALKEVEKMNERMLMDNALKGLYNSTFSIFTAKNKFGWRDEQYIKGEGFNQIFNIVIPKDYKPSNPNNRILNNLEKSDQPNELKTEAA